VRAAQQFRIRLVIVVEAHERGGKPVRGVLQQLGQRQHVVSPHGVGSLPNDRSFGKIGAMPISAVSTRDATRVLFTPCELGGLNLRNRLIMAPMGTCLDEGGHITDATIAYYVRRARGGVGTITVEGCLVSADTVGPEPKISGPEYLPGLRRLVEAL